jgi:hypothetical protein
LGHIFSLFSENLVIMKWFKLFDIGIQVIMTLVAIVTMHDKGFFIFYFGVGGWQVFSCLVHLTVYDAEARSKTRRKYEKLLGWVLGIGAVSGALAYMDIDAGIAILFGEGCIMLVGGIAMAIWYWTDCFVETTKLFDGESVAGDRVNQHNK